MPEGVIFNMQDKYSEIDSDDMEKEENITAASNDVASKYIQMISLFFLVLQYEHSRKQSRAGIYY